MRYAQSRTLNIGLSECLCIPFNIQFSRYTLSIIGNPTTVRHLIPWNIADVPSGTDTVMIGKSSVDFQAIPHFDALRIMRHIFHI